MTKYFLIISALLFLCLSTGNAVAQEQTTHSGVVDILPAKSISGTPMATAINEDAYTHPPVRLTPDKSEIINLDREAASIIIGNPNHLGILADSAKRIVLVPRIPGTSYFTILDRDGNVIMQRHAIIASPKENYVRIRRSCAGSKNADCQPTQVFYCPDMCHEIMIGTPEDTAKSGAGDKIAPKSTAAAETLPNEPPKEETE